MKFTFSMCTSSVSLANKLTFMAGFRSLIRHTAFPAFHPPAPVLLPGAGGEPGPPSPAASWGEGAEKHSSDLRAAHSTEQIPYRGIISGRNRYGSKAAKCVF